jgi:hypothetical protein
MKVASSSLKGERATEDHTIDPSSSINPSDDATPRKLMRGYLSGRQTSNHHTPPTAATGGGGRGRGNDPTPRKLIRGLMSSTSSPPPLAAHLGPPTTLTSHSSEQPQPLRPPPSGPQDLIKGFLVSGDSESSFSSSPQLWSADDTEFHARAHQELVENRSFRDQTPKIVDGTFTLSKAKTGSETREGNPKDLIRGFVVSEAKAVTDSREWSAEDEQFNREACEQLLRRPGLKNCFPRIVDGTLTLGSLMSPLAPLWSPDAPALSLDVGSQPETETTPLLISQSPLLFIGEEDRVLTSPLPLPSQSPSMAQARRASRSPSVTARQRKSLVVLTQPGEGSAAVARRRSHPLPPPSPSVSITGGSSHPASPAALCVSIPWTSSSDSLHLSSPAAVAAGGDRVEFPEQQHGTAGEVLNRSRDSSSASSSTSDSESSEEEGEMTISTIDDSLEEQRAVPFLPPPPTTLSLLPTTRPSNAPPPPAASSTPPLVLPLPVAAPLSPYKRSSLFASHLAFLDLLELALHLVNALLLLLILASVCGCLALVYIRHRLLSSDEESVTLFGLEISPAMIAL